YSSPVSFSLLFYFPFLYYRGSIILFHQTSPPDPAGEYSPYRYGISSGFRPSTSPTCSPIIRARRAFLLQDPTSQLPPLAPNGYLPTLGSLLEPLPLYTSTFLIGLFSQGPSPIYLHRGVHTVPTFFLLFISTPLPPCSCPVCP